MTYTDELAKLIMDRFGVSKAQTRVWKTRGSLPKKYFQDGKLKESLEVPKSVERSGRIVLEVLGNPKLHKAEILSLCGLSSQQYQDAVRKDKKTSLSPDAALRLKQELLDLRRDLKTIISPIRASGRITEKLTDDFISQINGEKRIKLRPCMMPDLPNYERIKHYHQRGMIEDEAVRAAVTSIEILILEMKIA